MIISFSGFRFFSKSETALLLSVTIWNNNIQLCSCAMCRVIMGALQVHYLKWPQNSASCTNFTHSTMLLILTPNWSTGSAELWLVGWPLIQTDTKSIIIWSNFGQFRYLTELNCNSKISNLIWLIFCWTAQCFNFEFQLLA